jgi:hypothetical protein
MISGWNNEIKRIPSHPPQYFEAFIYQQLNKRTEDWGSGRQSLFSVSTFYLVTTYMNSKYFFPSNNHPFLNSMIYTVEKRKSKGEGIVYY